MNPPKAPGTNVELPSRKPDLEIVDVPARELIEDLQNKVDELQEKNDDLEIRNHQNEDKLNALSIHLSNFELSTLEHLSKPSSSSTPPANRIKKWAVVGTVLAALITTAGAITAAYINSKASAASRQQQAEVARQVVLDSQKSTSEAFMNGVREGAHQAILELEKNKEIPPIQKPSPDVIKNKKKASRLQP